MMQMSLTEIYEKLFRFVLILIKIVGLQQKLKKEILNQRNCPNLDLNASDDTGNK